MFVRPVTSSGHIRREKKLHHPRKQSERDEQDHRQQEHGSLPQADARRRGQGHQERLRSQIRRWSSSLSGSAGI